MALSYLPCAYSAHLHLFSIRHPCLAPVLDKPLLTLKAESINNTSLMCPSSGRIYRIQLSLTTSHLSNTKHLLLQKHKCKGYFYKTVAERIMWSASFTIPTYQGVETCCGLCGYFDTLVSALYLSHNHEKKINITIN